MAKTMKLKAALDRQKGVNHKLEKQKKQQKEAEKRKRAKQQPAEAEAGGDGADGEQDVDFAALENVLAGAEVVEVGGDDDDAKVDRRQKPSKGNRKERRAAMLAAKAAAEAQEITNGATVEDVEAKGDAEGWETDESEGAENDAEVGAMSDESESDSEIENDPADNDEDEAEEEDKDEEDIALSDLESLASEDKEDVVPHQRLTINNTAALARSLKSFALPASLPFSAVQAITSEDPVDIPDVEDDLNRELAFYRQSLNAVTEARVKLKAEGVSFSRPTDYFAEMVKSEEQMGKVRAKLLDETARKKASSDARRQRDLKKFGKQVQVAKLQERQKEKTATLDRIQTLKRSKPDSCRCDNVKWEANLVIQNVKAQTSQPMKQIHLTSRWKTLLPPQQRTRLIEEPRGMVRERGKRRTRSLDLEAKRDSGRAMMPSQLQMTVGTLCAR